MQQPLVEEPVVQPVIVEPAAAPVVVEPIVPVTNVTDEDDIGTVLFPEDEAKVFNTMTVRAGIKKHGDRAMESIMQEFQQLKDKNVFEPCHYGALSDSDKKKILRSLMFLKEKRDGRLKSRFCADGSKQGQYLDVSEWSSPTALTESVLVTSVIEAHEGRTVVTCDIDGAYLYADMPERVFIELDEIMTDIMLKIWPELSLYVRPNGKVVLRLMKALYGCVQSSKLFYEHLANVLVKAGFKANAYENCVFNKTMYGVQCTVAVYVDDIKISSKDPRAVEDTINDLKSVYKKLTISRGKILDYLGMQFNYTSPGVVSVSMFPLIEEILEELKPEGKAACSPAAKTLFEVNENAERLSESKKEFFHSEVAKLLYIAKRGRPDVLTAVSFLTTRVSNPDDDDYKKLMRVASYLQGTKDKVLVLGAKDILQLHAYIDASHAVHHDAKGHTGLAITLGIGVVACKSTKQKLVAKSSTVAELFGLSDAVDHVIWIRELMMEQGLKMKSIIVHQDNKSTIILAERGRSNSQRTRSVNIRYYAITDLIERGEIVIEHTGSKEMIADYFTKPLQGKLFKYARGEIMHDII
jgi:hypothetical protein